MAGWRSVRPGAIAVAIATASVWLFAAAHAGQSPALPSSTPESVGFSSDRLRRLDAYLQELVTRGRVPGASALLSRHGKVVSFKVYGEADSRSGAPITRDSIFRIYSQTKPVTGVAMMLLFEEAKWHLDDPITKFIPEFKQLRALQTVKADGSLQLEEVARAPTMRELLTHSAGFGYGLAEDNPVDKAYRQSDFMAANDATDAIERLAKLPLAGQPGMHWRYSAAVDIQGYIIERLSGQTLAEFMQQRIFGPLAMNDTAFYVPADKRQRLVSLRSYDAASNSLVDPTGVLVFDYSKPPRVASGGAGLVSTAADYARFAQMLLNGGELDGVRILSPATVKLLSGNLLDERVRAKPEEPFSAHSGVGFGADVAVVEDAAKAGTLSGVGTYSWNGAAGTWFWIDPKNDVVFVGMIQVMNRWSEPHLVNLDKDTQTLVYQALLHPEK
ncbi:MAG: beta-lactamase family protein [Pseudomonadota bacterium]|nr:beta-lactamase family protein [Pseudomonadota bacterium]